MVEPSKNIKNKKKKKEQKAHHLLLYSYIHIMNQTTKTAYIYWMKPAKKEKHACNLLTFQQNWHLIKHSSLAKHPENNKFIKIKNTQNKNYKREKNKNENQQK